MTVPSFKILKISAGVWTDGPSSPMYRFFGELCFRSLLCSQYSMAQVLLAKVATPPDTLSPRDLDYKPLFTLSHLSHGHSNPFANPCLLLQLLHNHKLESIGQPSSLYPPLPPSLPTPPLPTPSIPRLLANLLPCTHPFSVPSL